MKCVISKKERHVTVISLNRPEKLNAFNSDMMNELMHAVKDAAEDKQTHVIVINSACTKAFSAGGDLDEEKSLTADNAMDFAHTGQKCMDTIYHCPVPVILVIHGYALGAAMELMLVSDITIAAEHTVIGMPAVRLASLTAFGGIAMLVRRIGYFKTADILYTGRNYSASEVFDMGLVRYIFPYDRLQEEAMAIAQKIAEYSPNTLMNMKKMLQTSQQLPFKEAREKETMLFAEQYHLLDRQEALQAFFEKRKPKPYTRIN